MSVETEALDRLATALETSTVAVAEGMKTLLSQGMDEAKRSRFAQRLLYIGISAVVLDFVLTGVVLWNTVISNDGRNAVKTVESCVTDPNGACSTQNSQAARAQLAEFIDMFSAQIACARAHPAPEVLTPADARACISTTFLTLVAADPNAPKISAPSPAASALVPSP